MIHVYPDLDWYAERSRTHKLSIRCPHANVHSCPRYFQSLSLLGAAGITTRIESKTDFELEERWKKTPLWPVVAEHATSIMNRSMYANFCPEVAFDTFNLFASYLSRYADAIDKEQAERWLIANSRAFAKDWRRDWQSVSEMHYSECPLYAQLPLKQVPTASQDEVFTLKPQAFGMSVDIKRLVPRVVRWWKNRRMKSR